jgi:hypothetical protein
MRLFRAGAVPKRKFARRGAGVCSNRTNPALMISLKVFSIASVRAGARAEKRLPPVTRISYKRRTLRHLSMNSRRRCAPQRRSLFAPVICLRPGWRQRPAGVGMRAKMYVMTNTYERRAGGRKGCPGRCAPCFSPVINNEGGMRMLRPRAAGTAPGQAPGTSEKPSTPGT